MKKLDEVNEKLDDPNLPAPLSTSASVYHRFMKALENPIPIKPASQAFDAISGAGAGK